MPVYMILTDDGCDQIVETRAIAEREKRDLTKLGARARIKEFPSRGEAEAYEDKLRNW